MAETRIAASVLAQVLGIQGLFSGDDSEMMPITLPDVIDKEAIAALPEEVQLKVLTELIGVNCEVARGICTSLDLVHPPKRRKSSAQTLDFKQVAKLLAVKSSENLLEQYQDFGLWQTIASTTKECVEQAEALINKAADTEVQAKKPETLGELLRESTVVHCGQDLDLLRQEASFDESKVELLKKCLESGVQAVQQSL
eukprot:m.18971 g.18971  ORF g.18971 m.18971 type:complete len:198 (-) comp10873_c0_seq1:58-651(-)